MRYEIRIEKTASGYSAYVPGLPGCVAAAETREETERLIEEAIAFHREGLALEHSSPAR
jgi:predicted RNase H-like HicB family nuclease